MFTIRLQLRHMSLIEHLIAMMEREPGNDLYFGIQWGNVLPSLIGLTFGPIEYKEVTPWMRMRIYWVDERCVPAEDYESNYGTMRRLLLDEVGMPDEYVYPIYGVNRPEIEAKNYSTLVCRTVPLWGGFPAFDVVLLGAGDDGHTSSIFPGQEYLLSSFHPYEVSVNPYNGQKRIAMTGCLLFAAKNLIFFVTGKNKADVVRDILDSGDTGPAAYVAHHAERVELFLDAQANGGKMST